MLEGLGLTQEQFIDMCILCGCDYCGTIKGGQFSLGIAEMGQLLKSGCLEAVKNQSLRRSPTAPIASVFAASTHCPHKRCRKYCAGLQEDEKAH